MCPLAREYCLLALLTTHLEQTARRGHVHHSLLFCPVCFWHHPFSAVQQLCAVGGCGGGRADGAFDIALGTQSARRHRGWVLDQFTSSAVACAEACAAGRMPFTEGDFDTIKLPEALRRTFRIVSARRT